MTSITSSQSFNLDEPPSCIAFCPTNPQFFVIGTYLLHPKDENEEDNAPQRRSGKLLLYQLVDGRCSHISTTSTPEHSILDIKWSPHASSSGKDLLVVATSTGLLEFYHFSIAQSGPLLEHYTTHQVASPEILVLYLTWHNTLPDILGLTLSDGSVQLLQSTPTDLHDEAQLWSSTDSTITTHLVFTHSLEAWCLACLPQPKKQQSISLFSGGDDLTFQASTPLYPLSSSFATSPAFLSRKLHNAGITFILPLPSTTDPDVSDDLILTGSYDDHIRLIRLPPSPSLGAARTGRAQILAEENLEGGVWRLQMLPPRQTPASENSGETRWTVLASCMHAGARVVQLVKSEVDGGEEEWRFEVVGKFEEHKSMNYGSDVYQGEEGKTTVVSTSFYDKLVCVWEI